MEFIDYSCKEFVDILASNKPVPGGGGAAALVGALGAALGNMVGSLTVGKEAYADVEADILAAKEKCDQLQQDLLAQVRGDAEAFTPLANAYRVPKDDPERAQILEDATIGACTAPMKIMELCCDAIDILSIFAEKGAHLAISDAGCGAALCKAGLQAASLSVYINTKSMHNREIAEQINEKANAMLNAYCTKADRIFYAVLAKF